jgi:hypothetical protein
MDRVGVEPTNSAHSILIPSAVDGKKLVQIPPAPLFFFAYPIVFCTVKRSFEKKFRHKGAKAHIIERGPFNVLKLNKLSKLISYSVISIQQ